MGIFGKLFGKRSESEPVGLPELPDVGGPDIGTEAWTQPGTNQWESPNIEEPTQIGRSWSSRRDDMEQYDVPEMKPAVSGERYAESVSPKDVQLIMSKLDLISSRLDNLTRRLESFEAGKRSGNVW